MNRMLQQVIPHGTCMYQLQFVRCKGHNKFSNIKHIKAAKDAEHQNVSSRYSREISWAVKNNGMITDPQKNQKLAR